MAGTMLGGVLVAAALWYGGYGIAAPSGNLLVGRWVPLSALDWQYAQTSWLGVGYDDRPARDQSVRGGPLQAGGRRAARGLGTIPLTEIVYQLDGRYALLRTRVGVEDHPWQPGGARLVAVLDGAVVYDSGPLHAGEPPRAVELPLAGGDELRLLTAPVPGVPPAFAAWLDAALFAPIVPVGGRVAAGTRAAIQGQHAAREALRQADETRLEALTAETIAGVDGPRHQADRGPGTAIAEIMRSGNPEGSRIVLANEHLLLVLGVGGDDHGLLSVLDRRGPTLVAHRVGGSIMFADLAANPPQREIDLHTDTRLAAAPEQSVQLARVADPIFGAGQVAEVQLQANAGDVPLQLRLTLLADRPAFLWELDTGVPATAATDDVRVTYFDGRRGEWFFGDGAQYLTDFSRLRHGGIHDDGVERPEPVAMGSPVFVWRGRLPGGLLLAATDEHRRPARWTAQRDPGHLGVRMSFQTDPAVRRPSLPAGDERTWVRSPRLYVELTESRRAVEASRFYREAMAALYPAPPLPPWVRYQWGSWYVHKMDISEQLLKEHVDFIAEVLGDLGPWHILVDAGWYVAEGRPAGGWRNPDVAKFPYGLPPLVDYAHARGIRVILYFSAPYLDNRQQPDNWLGLQGLIEDHPEWLILLGDDGKAAGYAMDFDHPGLRAYVREVLADFFVRYGVDGMLVDGTGQHLGAALASTQLDEFALVDAIVRQTTDIYRFLWSEARRLRPDAFIEGGWLSPRQAAPYAHTWRFADDTPAFSHPYPETGLIEHIDYASVQLQLLGQRPHMGAALGDPHSPANRWLLGAALAMDTQVVLGLDLRGVSSEVLADYRALLVHYRPFEGRTVFDQTLYPSVFATTRGDLAFLGLLNRDAVPRRFRVELAAYGLDAGVTYAVYDTEDEGVTRVEGTLELTVPAESFRLLVLRHEPGVLWTSSAYTVRHLANELRLVLHGPQVAPGFLHLVTPRPRAVRLDGMPLRAADDAEADHGHYAYDGTAGVLHLRYPHTGGTRVLRLLY